MTSRLEKLFLLLESGSSVPTRRAAATQLGEIQRLHPHELPILLGKLIHFLRSPSWETRVAASQAVGAIVKNVPQWFPDNVVSVSADLSHSKCLDANVADDKTPLIKFSHFDIHAVIDSGNGLLACHVSEFDDEPQECDANNGDTAKKEKLARQKHLLNVRLGLEEAYKFGVDTADLFSADDLEVKQEADTSITTPKDASHAYKIEEMLSRASNRPTHSSVKRLKSELAPIGEPNDTETTPTSKKLKSSPSQSRRSSTDGTCRHDFHTESSEWPLESFFDQLSLDLFSPSWQIRHGAASAMREILKQHGRCGGRRKRTPSAANGISQDELNKRWLDETALRLVCVLALDRFGDFVADEVVAPVRETSAQTLGSVLNIMEPEAVHSVLSLLRMLLTRKEWEARHGALLGIKYLLAVRSDLAPQLLPSVFDDIFQSLSDPVDDVSSVAAASLIPVRDVLKDALPGRIASLVAFLWDSLERLDDLSSSTSSILLLLSSLLSFVVGTDAATGTAIADWHHYVPRLWQFISHASSVVRRSVLETIKTLLLSGGPLNWLSAPIVSQLLRLLFQRALVENMEQICPLLLQTWTVLISTVDIEMLLDACCPYVSSWLLLMMHPAKAPIDVTSSPAWYSPEYAARDADSSKLVKMYLGGGDGNWNPDPSRRESDATAARLLAASMLGSLFVYASQDIHKDLLTPLESLCAILVCHLSSSSAVQRTCVAWVLVEWSKYVKMSPRLQVPVSSLPDSLVQRMLHCLSDGSPFDEVGALFARLQTDANGLFARLETLGMTPTSGSSRWNPSNAVLTMDQVNVLLKRPIADAMEAKQLKRKELAAVQALRDRVADTLSDLHHQWAALGVRTSSALAAALVAWDYKPQNWNAIIRPLMESVKRETCPELQHLSATHLVRVVDYLALNNVQVSQKVVKNLMLYLCSNSQMLPSMLDASPGCRMSGSGENSSEATASLAPMTPSPMGILSLARMEHAAESVGTLRRSNSTVGRRLISNHEDDGELVESGSNAVGDTCSASQLQLQERGAALALSLACIHFGRDLPVKLSYLWQQVFQKIPSMTQVMSDEPESAAAVDLESAKELVNSLLVLETLAPNLDPALRSHLVELLHPVCKCLGAPHAQVRHLAARVIAAFGAVIEKETMELTLDEIIGRHLAASEHENRRKGAIESISCLIEKLRLKIVPYVALLIVPVLGRMADQCQEVRRMATHSFAQLIQIFPLDSSAAGNDAMTSWKLSPKMARRREEERDFVDQLMGRKKADDYVVACEIKADLRSYQQEGVNWLAFLKRYNLHGILCDEMGLGKTLMSICILGSEHAERRRPLSATSPADSTRPARSIVICPPTLTGHWFYEVTKFTSASDLRPLHYTGPPAERQRLQSRLETCAAGSEPYNLVIASYDIVRNDIEFFSSIVWNYCIIDEGHVIKNGKTKMARAIKTLRSSHRLILTGTPIQNNVLDLWSLFDFLMPGFLGTEKSFLSRYAKPILLSRDAKSSSREQQAGVLAAEALHRQVLPFVLRRVKEDVLDDLPPKIMQDYYCQLSPLQSTLYEDFARSQVRQELQESLDDTEQQLKSSSVPCHIFQALQYLRKVCNHPKLVLIEGQHPEYARITSRLLQQQQSKSHNPLDDISHSAKLIALKQLLLDCGIGTEPTAVSAATSTSATLSSSSCLVDMVTVVNQHRALIFCQLKSMLDIVERDLLQSSMPSVTYLRLDGSVPPGQRHDVVHRFNNDPSIDVLLLTTQVGGLGLNLTGADTVIFVEHDWNPMKDLQAMDRAHRIGQKKVVNVYRLITSGTLEEKIMSLQRFKLSIAKTVISEENSSLSSMATHDILDLFNLDHSLAQSAEESVSKPGREVSRGAKSILDSLPELHGMDQYESEYDLTDFLKSLTK